VLTPFGLFPTNINPADVITALANGAVQGVTDALNDLKSPQLFDTSWLSGLLAGLHTIGDTPSNSPSLLQLLAGFATLANAGVPVSSSGIVNTLTSVVSNAIAVALPLADTALAIGASLPAYDAQLFVSQLRAGNLLNAIGMPIAADFALVPYALIFGAVFPVLGAVANAVTQLAELAGLQPNPAAATPAAPTALAALAAASSHRSSSAAALAGHGTAAGEKTAHAPAASAMSAVTSTTQAHRSVHTTTGTSARHAHR
jgi:hypothetical protein